MTVSSLNFLVALSSMLDQHYMSPILQRENLTLGNVGDLS